MSVPISVRVKINAPVPLTSSQTKPQEHKNMCSKEAPRAFFGVKNRSSGPSQGHGPTSPFQKSPRTASEGHLFFVFYVLAARATKQIVKPRGPFDKFMIVRSLYFAVCKEEKIMKDNVFCISQKKHLTPIVEGGQPLSKQNGP